MQAKDIIPKQFLHLESLQVNAADHINMLVAENASLRQENEELKKQLFAQSKTIQKLLEKIKELEAKISKNSQNSSKPPASDGLNKQKTKSQREKSGKKPGGQIGRLGKTLVQVENPDHVISHAPSSCAHCACNLSDVEGVTCKEKRQVFDIPEPKIEVIEHRIETKRCPCCGEISKGAFPSDIGASVQYGERVQALSVYLRNQHLIPVERVCEIFEDVFEVSLAAGSCSKFDKKIFVKLGSFEVNLKSYLIASQVLNFDETGMRCNKKLHWVHVASSESATFYGIHAKRGQEAIDEFGILPEFTGVAIHDHWFPYFVYRQVLHGLCNAHHLRELTYIHEQEKEEWAAKMKEFLIAAKKEVGAHASVGSLPVFNQIAIEEAYAEILAQGFAYHEKLSPLPKGKRGRQKQRDGKNLLNRFKEKQDCVLRFLYDFKVPFTNNAGEQDIRMIKVKQKISGCFRTHYGGQIFCRIRSYISTAQKQAWGVWNALIEAVKGKPKLLPLQTV